MSANWYNHILSLFYPHITAIKVSILIPLDVSVFNIWNIGSVGSHCPDIAYDLPSAVFPMDTC